jgi:hypothetical protein
LTLVRGDSARRKTVRVDTDTAVVAEWLDRCLGDPA